MVYSNIKEIDKEAHIVVQKSNINYLAPIDKDFIAECTLSDKKSREVFFKTYRKHNKARISLKVTCSDEHIMLAEYQGQYVAFK